MRRLLHGLVVLLLGVLGCSGDPEHHQIEQPVVAPDSDCKPATFGGIDYWYCANLRTFEQARARCQAIEMDLTVIDSGAEDSFLLSFIDEHAFIGARRSAGTLSWRWLGFDQEFWVGDRDGQAVGGAYTNWEIGHPDTINAFRRDCGAKKKTAPAGEGRWLSVKCNEPRPYICEKLDLCPNNPDKLDPGQCGCAVDDTDTDGDGTADCLDACPNDVAKQVPGACGCGVADTDTDGDGFQDCVDDCPNDATNAACIARDGLPAPRPVPHIAPSATTIPQTPVDPNNCVPESGALQPLPQGTTDPTEAQVVAMFTSAPNPTGYDCEPVQDDGACPLVESTVGSIPCTSDADCAAGERCRWAKTAACLAGPTPTDCLEGPYCGVPDPGCLADPLVTTCDPPDPTCTVGGEVPSCAQTDTCPCSEIDVCPPGPYGTSGPDPGSDLSEETIAESAVIQAKKRPDAPAPYVDPPSGSDCLDSINGRCWCRLAVPQIFAIDDPHGKQSEHGGGGVVNFTFKPDVKFAVDAQARPFGESKFDLEARATFLARGDVSILAISDGADLVNLVASARADRCRFRTSDSQFKVFGVDFVDVLDVYDTDAALGTLGKDCDDAFLAFELAGHRAKKALRDAQALVETYRALPEGVGFDPVQFCSTVYTTDTDYPASLPDPCAAAKDHATPARMINRFISYYNDRAKKLREAMRVLQAKSATLRDALAIAKPNGTIPIFNYPHHDGYKLVNMPFFVGPIPMNLEIELLLDYEIAGEMHYAFKPTSMIAMPAGTPTQLAAATAALRPSATAVLDMFVGAGFDVPGFTAKAGISGYITLAVVTSNLDAGVGLSAISKLDERPLPTGLAAIGSGELVFPLRAHQLFADWFFDAKAGLHNILDGTLNAKVKLKALFFKKTWKKTIASFKSPFSLPDIDLLHGGDRLGGKPLPVSALAKNSLGLFEMQLPFLEIEPLAVPTSAPATTQPITLPPAPGLLGYTVLCEVPVPQ